MELFVLLAGIAILFLGRQIFWLFVAMVGAIEGGRLGLAYFADHAVWVQVAAVVGGGLLGALVGIFLQPVAAMIVGFYAGGIVVQDLALRWGLAMPDYAWLPFVVGGVVGAVLMLMIFDWALIVLSSLYGATLIVQSTAVHGLFGEGALKFFFVILFVIGIIVQALLFKRNPSPL